MARWLAVEALFLVAVSAAALGIMQVSGIGEDPLWWQISPRALPFNLILFAAPLSLLRCFLERRGAALFALSAAAGLSALNAQKLLYLHEPINPSDISKIYFIPYMVKFFGWREYAALIAMLLPAIGGLFWRFRYARTPKRAETGGRWIVFSICGLLAAVVVAGGEWRARLFPNDFRDTRATQLYGYFLQSALSAEGLHLRAPAGYSAEKLKADLGGLTGGYGFGGSAGRDDRSVVVVLLESFYDLQRLRGLAFRSDFLPFYHSLLTDSRVLNDLTPKTGGGTANAEYEIFTGLPIHALPGGAVPFEELVHRDLPTVQRELSARGFSTIALHPWSGRAWNRDHVYPNLGFQKFVAAESLPAGATDETVFHASLALLQLNPAQRQFQFIATADTHAPYLKKPGGGDWLASGKLAPGLTDEINAYASAMRILDSRLEAYFRELKKLPRPPVVVLFGDHQPEFTGQLPGAKRDGLGLYRNEVLVWGTDLKGKDHNDQDLYCLAPLLLKEATGSAWSDPYFHFVDDFCRRHGSLWSLDAGSREGRELWERFRRLSYDRLIGDGVSRTPAANASRPQP